MSWRDRIQTTLESIDYQKSHHLFEELALAVSELRKLPANKNALEIAGITKIIHARTGLNLDGEYLPHYFNASIMPPFLDARSPLTTYLVEGLKVTSKDRLGLDHSKISDMGTIDLSKAYVTGVFSKVRGKLYVGRPVLDLLTDRELAAVILHEVGHNFAFFEYITHTSTLAVNLNYCASELANTNDRKQRVKIIINTVKNLNTELDDPEALADSKSIKTVLSVILESYTRRVRSGTGSNFYDFRSYEALADQFATRQGGGKDLVVALDKINTAFGNYSHKGTFGNAYEYISEVIGMVSIPVMAYVSPIVGAILALFVGILLISPFPPEGTYDDPVARLTRVKNELVGHLKDKTLLPEYQIKLQQDIEAIDEIIDRIGKTDTFLNKVWRVLTSYRRKNYRQIGFQQELEKLANNELFLSASKLATLTP